MGQLNLLFARVEILAGDVQSKADSNRFFAVRSSFIGGPKSVFSGNKLSWRNFLAAAAVRFRFSSIPTGAEQGPFNQSHHHHVVVHAFICRGRREREIFNFRLRGPGGGHK